MRDPVDPTDQARLDDRGRKKESTAEYMSYLIWLAAFSLALFISNISQSGSKAAEFEMEIDNHKYDFVNGLRKYHHARRYVVSSDIGITVTKGKVCYIEQKKSFSAWVKYQIDAGKSLTQPRYQVATNLDEEMVTVKYWGKDVTGNKFSVKKTSRLNGNSIKIK